MSKLAKSVDYPFTRGQPLVAVEARRTTPSPDTVVSFYLDYERMNWNLGQMLEIDWREVKAELLTQADVYVVESAMLVESNDPDYLTNLVDYFRADQDICDFLMIWGMEEWKHYYALRDYLQKVRLALAAREPALDTKQDQEFAAIDQSVRAEIDAKVADVRETSTTHWQIPQHYLPVQVLAATTLQEFVTAEFYRNHSQQTREPILARLELLLAKDETRHEMFYEKRVTQILAANPSLVGAVVEALKEFGMPGAFLLDDYEPRRAAMEAAAFPTLTAKREAFSRLYNKASRLVGRENALRIFTDGNYFTDGLDTPRRRVRPDLVSRLIAKRLAP